MGVQSLGVRSLTSDWAAALSLKGYRRIANAGVQSLAALRGLQAKLEQMSPNHERGCAIVAEIADWLAEMGRSQPQRWRAAVACAAG